MSKHTRIVYGLSDPRSASLDIRYVGCTCQKPANRLRAHIHEALISEACSDRIEWIQELLRADQVPVISILETIKETDDWEERERHWIKKFPSLVNNTAGGVGTGGMPEHQRNKIAAALRGRKASPESLERRAATTAANPYRHSEERKRKISEAHSGKVRGALPADVKAKLAASISRLIWVTDGTTNRRISPDKVPDGWKPGRSKASNILTKD